MPLFPPVLVLAAGLGTRLRPLTCLRAKPALPLAGEPLIGRILRWLQRSGATDVIINLHHRPETITAIVGDGAAYSLHVRYSWEQPVLGSGGGPRRALSLIDADELMVVNGDTITDVDLGALLGAHRRSRALVTMAVIDNPRPARYGGVAVDQGVVTGFARPGAAGGAATWHFIGAQMVQRDAFAAVEDGEVAESVRSTYPALMSSRPGSVRAFTTRARFHDIGTPETYLDTALALAGGEPHRLIDPRARIAASARVVRSIVWDEVEIAAEAELNECIVAEGVRIPAGARYHRAVLVPAERAGYDTGAAATLDGVAVVPMASAG